ncbi:MAG: hypothetical protein AAF567_15310 [Actinomycetota bacterium]
MSLIDGLRAQRTTAPEPSARPEADARGELRVIDGGFDRAARWIRLLGTTLLCTLIIGLVGVLIVHATIIEDQRALDDQRRAIATLEADTEALRHELAELEAPARVVAEARDLGMIEAPAVTYLTSPGGLLDERTIVVAENQLLAG